jgi:hypothetical protein
MTRNLKMTSTLSNTRGVRVIDNQDFIWWIFLKEIKYIRATNDPDDVFGLIDFNDIEELMVLLVRILLDWLNYLCWLMTFVI